MKKFLSIASILSILFSASIVAKEASSEKQAKANVQFRKAILQLVRSNMGPLGAMAKGQIPYDSEVMMTNGLRIEQLSYMMEDYFATDTRKFELKTDASDDIWENQDDFNSLALDMADAAAKLQKVAEAGDEANYRKAIGSVGATCKACHDKYKTD
ncbi:cytochrome c [Glaciecola sp. MH2013]|uniref:c-type cytochrome n=1 Tax=Glaciecola sp. MH2013 TaxID=2785524 RepID=UPI00189D6A4A|nr:cytochrome c [Glaciecola sp. MH2013]MBF7072535.1 cytochrome c [Glaciecola sp. MH2013]